MVFDSLLNKLYELLLPQGPPGKRNTIEDPELLLQDGSVQGGKGRAYSR